MKNLLNLVLLLTIVGTVVSCKSDKGAKAEVAAKGEVAAAVGKSYNVDNTTSKVMWIGSKPAGSHNGTVNVSGGNVTVSGGKVTGGTFTLDMNSITCLDLEGGKKEYLESHLKGLGDDNADDFFNVKAYPTAKFEITKVTGLANDADGNLLVYGNLTMKDVTKQVGFKANVDVTDGMVKVTSQKFNIDRTEWGIKYNSGKFFDDLKDKAIDDKIALQVSLVAKA